MADPIKLPPLPDNLISMSHGPFKPSLYDKGETYCVLCHTRSIYLASRQCNPHIDPDALRARDLEVARLALKAAAGLVDGNAAYCSGQTAAILVANADAIRKMEVRHHE